MNPGPSCPRWGIAVQASVTVAEDRRTARHAGRGCAKALRHDIRVKSIDVSACHRGRNRSAESSQEMIAEKEYALLVQMQAVKRTPEPRDPEGTLASASR